MNIKGQGHSLTDLGPRSLRFNIFFFFFLETAYPIEAKFYVEPPWDVRISLIKWSISHDQVGRHAHMWWKPKKKSIFSGTKKADDHVNWYAALGTRVLPS